MYCVARLPEIEKNPCAFDEYSTGSWRPFERVVLVREHLVHHLDERIARRDQEALLAVGREVHVAGPERLLLGACDRLLAERLHVERDLALPVRPQQPGVEAAHQHHVPQAGDLVGDREIGRPLADRGAVVVEHAEQLLAHQRDALDLLVERRLLHLAGLADEVHTVRRLVTAGRFGNAQPQRARVAGDGHHLRMSQRRSR